MEKTMVERGWKKHSKFFGQEEKEAHIAAKCSNSQVCYYCIAELEEKYGIDVAHKMRFIKF